jgi:hypothetical protein
VRAADALRAWERVASVPAARRGAELLSAVLTPTQGPAPLVSGVDADDLPVGRRDALLLDLHRTAFGDRLDALAACPSCGVVVEVEASCAGLLSGLAPQPVVPVEVDGYHVVWRPVTGADLASIVDDDGPEAAAATLLRRCLVEARGPAGPVPDGRLPGPVRAAVLDAMARADPGAEIAFAVRCPDCGAGWESQLDVAAFVWARVQARAHQVLHEVHTLALAYGWTEPEVLALSEPRRAAYLRLVGDG